MTRHCAAKNIKPLLLFLSTILLCIQIGQAQGDCNCANTSTPQHYKAKVDAGENVQVCSQCAALALYLCICDCATSTTNRQQLVNNIQTIQSTLRSYQQMGNDVCCPELMNVQATCTAVGSGSNNSNNNNSNNGSQGNNTGASLDPALTDLINQLANAAGSGNSAAVQTLINQILEIAQQAYPDMIEQIQNQINHTVNTAPHNNNHSGNQANNGTNKKPDYPEGWSYLKQYQNLLNNYVSECSHAVNGGDPTRLLNLATQLSSWMENNTTVFSRFTEAQSNALNKMTEYFAQAMMNCASGAVQNMQQVHYADEAEQHELPGNFVPTIQTGTINYTPDTKKPSGQYSGNGDLGNGNGMFENRPESDPGPVDYQHQPK